MGIKLAFEKRETKRHALYNKRERRGWESVYQLSLFIIGGVKTPAFERGGGSYDMNDTQYEASLSGGRVYTFRRRKDFTKTHL